MHPKPFTLKAACSDACNNFQQTQELLAQSVALTLTAHLFLKCGCFSNVQVELVPGGREKPVTNANKANYILLTANYRLNVEMKTVTEAFLRGVESIIPTSWLQLFNEEEFQMLIRGLQTSGIDVDELQRNVEYGNGYSNSHPTIKAFWQVVLSCLATVPLSCPPPYLDTHLLFASSRATRFNEDGWTSQ